MKHALAHTALAGTLALALAGCSGGNKAAEQPTLHEVMKEQIDANADKLWDATNDALGENAEIVPDKMDDAKWAEVADLATKVQAGANAIAAMNKVVVVKPGVKIADEDVPYGDSAADVQAAVDKDPELLKEFAQTLAAHMGEIAEAAKNHDAAKAGPLVDQLDGVCEDCHLQFWYPSQKDLVQKYRNELKGPPKTS